jgi:hypothetical protein
MNWSLIKNISNKKQIVIFYDLLLIAGVSIFLLAPLGHPRFFWSHDEAQLLWRITEFHANTVSGHIFSRWFPDFARCLGLPFLEYFPVLFLYMAEIFKLIGISTIGAAKAAIVASTILGSFWMYLLAKEFWGRGGGLLAAFLYTYAPYRIVDLYVRGDVNEYTAMAILPFNLLALYRLRSSAPSYRPSILLSLGIAALILCHYPSVIIQFPAYIVWIIFLAAGCTKPSKFVVSSAASILLGMLITLSWWATAFFNRNLVQMEGMMKGFADYRDQFIHPAQWFSLYWNFGASVKGTGDTISFQAGNLALILALLGYSAWRRMLGRSGDSKGSLWPFATALLAYLFLTTSASKFLWELTPVLPMLQFPYRLLQIPAFVLAFWSGSCVTVLEERFPLLSSAMMPVMIIIVVLSSLSMTNVAAYLNLHEKDLTPETVARVAHTHCTNEFTPRAAGKRFPPSTPVDFKIEKIPEEGYSRKAMEEKLQTWIKRAPEVEYWEGTAITLGKIAVRPQEISSIEGDPVTSDFSMRRNEMSVQIDSDSPSKLRWAQFYFEGWKASIDDKTLPLYPDPATGLIAFDIPPGSHRIELAYKNLDLARWLDIPALLSLLLAGILALLPRSRNNP